MKKVNSPFKMWSAKILTLLLCFCVTTSSAQFSVSPNKRFILRNGQPFFWLGDTAWELFHRLTKEEAEKYLKRRAEQGFTVIQAVVLAELDGINKPNMEGQTPLEENDPAKPNEKYFAHVDYVIDKAAELGLTIALLPTWGDKIEKSQWGKGPEIFTPANSKTFATWLARRYKNRKNIIWVLGGDRNPRNETDLAIWDAMGNAIKEETGLAGLITYHPQPNKLGSAQYFHNSQWLSFNMFQTGHCRDAAVYDQISSVYKMRPFKPVLDGEPIYEDHPVCFSAKDLGTSNSLDVRRAAYLNLFAGAFGHTYGCHDIWQMYNPREEPLNGPHHFWYDAMELPGANQMKYVRQLVEAFPMLERVPDQSLIMNPATAAAERVQATRGADYCFVYTTAGQPFTVRLGKINGDFLKGFWYNPRKGTKTVITKFKNIGVKKFSAETSGYGQDWVLVLFDATKSYMAEPLVSVGQSF